MWVSHDTRSYVIFLVIKNDSNTSQKITKRVKFYNQLYKTIFLNTYD